MKFVGVVFITVLIILDIVEVGTSVDLNIRDPILISESSEVAPIILKSFGGDGTAEVEALIGDKILDLFLYQRVLTRFENLSVYTLTKLRDSMAANFRLAVIGEAFVVPHFMSPEDWERSNVHERATAIECIIGRKYLTSDANHNPIPQFTPDLVLFLNDVLIAIQKNMQTTRVTTHTLEPIYSVTNKKTVCVAEKGPFDSLLEWLKNRNLDPKTSLSIQRVKGTQTSPPGFVAKFQLSRPQPQPPLELESLPQMTERKAKSDVCKMAMQKLEIDTAVYLTLKLNHAPAEDPDNNAKNKLEQKKQATDILESADHQVSKHDTEDHVISLNRKLKKKNIVNKADPNQKQVTDILASADHQVSKNDTGAKLEDHVTSLKRRQKKKNIMNKADPILDSESAKVVPPEEITMRKNSGVCRMIFGLFHNTLELIVSG